MVSAVYPVKTVAGLELNTLGDGFSHVDAYLFTLTGLFLLGCAAFGRMAFSAYGKPTTGVSR